jgi:hypothetical protein
VKAGFARFCNTIYDTQQYFPLVHFRSSHSHYRSVAGHLATIAAFGPHTVQYSGQMCFVLSILIFFCDRLVTISPETITRWEDLMLDEYRYRTSASSYLVECNSRCACTMVNSASAKLGAYNYQAIGVIAHACWSTCHPPVFSLCGASAYEVSRKNSC